MSYNLTDAIRQVVLNAIERTYQGFSDITYERNIGHIDEEVVNYFCKEVLEKLAGSTRTFLTAAYPHVYAPFSEDKWLDIFQNRWEEFTGWRDRLDHWSFKKELTTIIRGSISEMVNRMNEAAGAW